MQEHWEQRVIHRRSQCIELTQRVISLYILLLMPAPVDFLIKMELRIYTEVVFLVLNVSRFFDVNEIVSIINALSGLNVSWFFFANQRGGGGLWDE